MPVKITCTGSSDCKVSTPHGVKAKHTTRAKANKQKRLLNAIEHGFVPNKEHTSKIKVKPYG